MENVNNSQVQYTNPNFYKFYYFSMFHTHCKVLREINVFAKNYYFGSK